MTPELLQRYGVWLLFGNVLVDQIGLPVPAFPSLVLASSLAVHRGPVLAELLIGSLAACELANFGWYFAGRRYGNRVLRRLCGISLSPDSCVSETQRRFERWGAALLLIAKFVPVVSKVAFPLAGASRMGLWRFSLYSTAGSLLWVAIGLGAGVWLGPQLVALRPQLPHEGRLLIVLLIALIALYIGYKFIQRRRFFAQLRMARISVAEIYGLIDAGAAPTVVDVRSAMAQQLDPRRIPGAIPMTLQTIAQRLKALPTDREIVLYCTCPNEASAARVAKVLIHHGFTRVRPLLGGLDAWLAAGYRLEPMAPPTTPAASMTSG